MRYPVLAFLLIAFVIDAAAQFNIPRVVDSAYIKRFPDVITVSPYVSSSAESIQLSPGASSQGLGTRQANYRPNLKGGYGIGFSYRIFDLALGWSQSLDSISQAVYGETNHSSFGLRMWATRKTMLEFSYKWTAGYSNLSGFGYEDTVRPADKPFPHRPDIRVRYIKLRGLYQFNPDKFSYRSAFAFSERQLKSKLGYFLSADVFFHRMKADSSIVPGAIWVDYQPYNMVHQMRIGGFGIAPGIGGTWTGGKWFLSGVLCLGADIQHFNYKLENTGSHLKELRLSPKVDFRYAWGYNSDRWFFGFQGWSDINVFNSKGLIITSLFNRTLFSLGFRFNTPRVVDRVYTFGVNKFIPKKYRPMMY
ncbi:MAG: DUF4421 domain-containing protein [Bacteroidetes bacterium]|nr:MAG: DUF4421 domain-containing protein [Bacteroidota bacterium]